MITFTYHDVTGDPTSSGFQGIGPDHYKIAPDRFERHVTLAHGRQVLFTFDDGGASSVDAARILERHGRAGVFFIVTSVIGSPGFLAADGIRELRDRGHRIGSHSHTHAFLTELGDDEVALEWIQSKGILEEILGEPVTTASVPRGAFTPRIAKLAPFDDLFTSEPWRVPRGHVHGRFAVTSATSGREVAALARGSWVATGRKWAGWRIRRAARGALGPRYEAVRRRVLSSSSR